MTYEPTSETVEGSYLLLILDSEFEGWLYKN